jgi:hypothetical protein
LRNATTDSPWPIWNNPFAKYNAGDRADCNPNLPLWKLVRGSTAAPVYFPPEVITLGPRDFIFVDGGVTMYSNPAFQMFLMATIDRYWPHVPTGKGRRARQKTSPIEGGATSLSPRWPFTCAPWISWRSVCSRLRVREKIPVKNERKVIRTILSFAPPSRGHRRFLDGPH